jgi:cell wall-associated NlpC family hydrolase
MGGLFLLRLEAMTHRTLLSFWLVTIFAALFFHATHAAQGQPSPALLPHVTREMETPEFWINKNKTSQSLLMKPADIQRMSEEILKRKELYLFDVRAMKETLTGEEITSLFREDLEGFGKTSEVRYGKDGAPLTNAFWNEMISNLNQESLNPVNRVLFALAVKRTDIRVFPTEQVSLSAPGNAPFDRYQHSSVSPGSLVGIYLFSKDRKWAYSQTGFIRGWIRSDDLAIARSKAEAMDDELPRERLVITGSFVDVFSDPALEKIAFSSQMGSTFPLLGNPGADVPSWTVRIPVRDNEGRLILQKGYISRNSDVHPGFLPYTQENVARQAFKMLHQPYGWGEMFGGRDCSRFTMDIFATFGIVMPRNSKFQAMVGREFGRLEGVRDKKRILDRAVPLATVFRLPGHIMLYLGKHRGRYYVIHSIWGIQTSKTSEMHIGRVVVSDLSLGASGPQGDLLRRITDARIITPELAPPKM